MKKPAVKEPSYVTALGNLFAPLPHLPQGFTQFIAAIFPFLTGLVGIVSLFSAIPLTGALIGLDMYIADVSNTEMIGWDIRYYLPQALFLIMIGVFYLKALPGLFKKQHQGWLAVFWGNVFGTLSMAYGLFFQESNLVTLVLSIVIGYYMLFELRPRYKN